MEKKKYLYEIRPKRPIPVPGDIPIRTRRSILLTKEEVMMFMQYGAVYRKYPTEDVLVTGENLDQLHRDPHEQAEKLQEVQPDPVEKPTSEEAQESIEEQERGNVTIPVSEPKNNSGTFNNYHGNNKKNKK